MGELVVEPAGIYEDMSGYGQNDTECSFGVEGVGM